MIVIIAIIIVVFFKGKVTKYFRKNFRLNEMLIPYYGGVTDLWNTTATPDEYIGGHKIRWGRRFKRLEFQSGRERMTAPMQAYGTLDYIDQRFETKPHGAKIVRTDRNLDENGNITNRDGQLKIVWVFDKSPYKYGISAGAKAAIMDEIQNSFCYFKADKWGLKLSRCQTPEQEELANRINNDIRIRGWLMSDNTTVSHTIDDR
jgi:hypothetical protein